MCHINIRRPLDLMKYMQLKLWSIIQCGLPCSVLLQLESTSCLKEQNFLNRINLTTLDWLANRLHQKSILKLWKTKLQKNNIQAPKLSESKEVWINEIYVDCCEWHPSRLPATSQWNAGAYTFTELKKLWVWTLPRWLTFWGLKAWICRWCDA